MASDQELKLTELLRYYMRDIQAAKVRHDGLRPSYKVDVQYLLCLSHMEVTYFCILNALFDHSSQTKPCQITQIRKSISQKLTWDKSFSED